MAKFYTNPVSTLLTERLIFEASRYQVNLVIAVPCLLQLLAKHDLYTPFVLCHIARRLYIVEIVLKEAVV